jgi:hypothetical protein
MEKLHEFLYSIVSDPKSVFAGVAIIVSLISLGFSLVERTRVSIEAVLQGLRGAKESITYMALHIRLTKLLSKRKYRRALISALLLAWNFEDSDRARSSILTALLEAKRKYPDTYDEVIHDLTRQFDLYGGVIGQQQIQKRGMSRLDEVLDAIKKAENQIASSKAAVA